MKISVPDPMKDWVRVQIDEGKYASSSDYVRNLTRQDQAAFRHLWNRRFRADYRPGRVERFVKCPVGLSRRFMTWIDLLEETVSRHLP